LSENKEVLEYMFGIPLLFCDCFGLWGVGTVKLEGFFFLLIKSDFVFS
jgi:hypothetical protein